MNILKKIFHLFLICMIAAGMLTMQKFYLDHHKDPLPVENETGEILKIKEGVP